MYMINQIEDIVCKNVMESMCYNFSLLCTISHIAYLLFPIFSHHAYLTRLLIIVYDTYAYSCTFVPHFSLTKLPWFSLYILT